MRVDERAVAEVVYTLLDNAAKYSPTASAIAVRAWREGGFVALQIMDEGDGIPPEDIGRIFDKFYRAQKGDQVRAGTGLGLAIARGFVEAMHGTIDAANRADRNGAVFSIRLPVPANAKVLDTAA